MISARLENSDLGMVMTAIQKNIVAKVNLPQGYHLEYGGAYAEQQQPFKELLIILITSNGDGTTTIIKQKTAEDYALVQTLKTQYRAKTLTLDIKTRKIYLSVADMIAGTRNAIPGTFKVLVYKMERGSSGFNFEKSCF